MTKHEMRVFQSFLRDKGVLNQFCDNFRNPEQTIVRVRWGEAAEWDEYLVTVESDMVMQLPFSWGRSPEGHKFWENLRNKWRRSKDSFLPLDINKLTRVI